MSYQKKCTECDNLAIKDGLCPSCYRTKHGMKKPEPVGTDLLSIEEEFYFDGELRVRQKFIAQISDSELGELYKLEKLTTRTFSQIQAQPDSRENYFIL